MIALAFLRRIPGFLSPRGWAVVAILTAFLAFGTYCSHRAAQGERDRQAVKTARVEAKASTGRETASVERLNDQTSLNIQRKANDDALNPLPDAIPSDRRRARHCLRLQRDGIDTSRLPECSGPSGQASAGR